jgi:hypothetical protein
MTELFSARRSDQDTAGYARLAGMGDLVASIGADEAAGAVELDVTTSRTLPREASS